MKVFVINVCLLLIFSTHGAMDWSVVCDAFPGQSNLRYNNSHKSEANSNN